MVAKIITFVNQKGGVGKSTSSVSVGDGLARAGKKVLVVDLDSQGNSTILLDLEPEPGSYYLLTTGKSENEKTFLKQWIRHTRHTNLDLIPGSRETAAAQILINAQQKPISCIRDNLQPFLGSYDYILFDTAPSEGGIQERAIWAADQIIIPTETEMLSIVGVKEILKTMMDLKQTKAWKGGLLCVLPTFFDEVATESAAGLKDLQNGFGSRLFKPIHKATVLSKCAATGQTIFEIKPACRAAHEYLSLVNFVLKN